MPPSLCYPHTRSTVARVGIGGWVSVGLAAPRLLSLVKLLHRRAWYWHLGKGHLQPHIQIGQRASHSLSDFQRKFSYAPKIMRGGSKPTAHSCMIPPGYVHRSRL